ncbi:MAG: hypothetical protein Q9M30_06885 [Mariprofundaceae bacterium]|nr:hypothetical protein [Mariprofundaceae bacterium]
MKKSLLIVCAAMLVSAPSAFAEGGKITSMAKGAGFTSCLSTVSKLEAFLGNKKNYGSWSFWANQGTDTQPYNASMEISFADGGVLVDFTVMPAADGTCPYVYTKTWYSKNNCNETSKQNFMKKAKYKGKLNKHVMAFTLGSAEVMLQAAGSGCMIQKKEIGFKFGKQNP